MDKITSYNEVQPGLHVAIVMDGNGRWAEARGLPRLAGHRRGADAVRRVVEAAPDLGIGTLTLFAFSADNWRRPAEEVNGLMALFHRYLARQAKALAASGVRLTVIGRRDRLPRRVSAAIVAAERATAAGCRLLLRLAVDYSARDAILAAAPRAGAVPTRETFARSLGEAYGTREPSADVDLLVRTGGEMRLSDFLLWEAAYAELSFTRLMWPDFTAADLEAALRDFQGRERRFGGLPGAPALGAAGGRS
jgi:undecaprenyl diphosphate synthase